VIIFKLKIMADTESIYNFDTHTVFITGIKHISATQLSDSLSDYFDRCKSLPPSTDRKFWGKWKINVVSNRLGETVGVAYVFFTKTEAYHALLGNNPDGSKRCGETPNPPHKEEERKESIKGDDIPCLSIRLTLNQQEKYHNSVLIPDVKPCLTYAPDSDYNKCTLFSKNIPFWVTESDLRGVFLPFVTAASDRNSGFPKITFVKQPNYSDRPRRGNTWNGNSKKNDKFHMAFVKFNPDNNNSLFVLVMTKKVTIKGSGANSNKKVDLIFDYARDQGYNRN